MIIVVDLDQTLLHSDWSISDYTIKVFKNCKAAGHTIVVNSARSLLRSIEPAKTIGADYINCFYGNLLMDMKGNTYFSRAFPKEKTALLLEELKGVSKWHAVETIDGGYGDTLSVCQKYNGKLVDKSELAGFDCFKIAVGLPYTTDCMDKAREIASKYDLDLNFAREVEMCSFLPKGTEKWLGIQRLLDILGVSKEDVISFGDHMTDYQTLKNSKIGVAMANSNIELLNKIQTHTLSNNQDGVAKYLYNILCK